MSLSKPLMIFMKTLTFHKDDRYVSTANQQWECCQFTKALMSTKIKYFPRKIVFLLHWLSLKPCLHVTFYCLYCLCYVSMVMGWITDRMGDDPFYSFFIDTMLNNNGPFFKKKMLRVRYLPLLSVKATLGLLKNPFVAHGVCCFTVKISEWCLSLPRSVSRRQCEQVSISGRLPPSLVMVDPGFLWGANLKGGCTNLIFWPFSPKTA